VRQLPAHVRFRFLGGIHDDRMPQAERHLQPARQRRIERGGQANFDVHDASRPCLLEDPCHLEPAHAELSGDIALGTSVDEEAPGDAGGADKLGRCEAGETLARVGCHRLLPRVTNR
jgi:hypothetical protein